MRAKSLQSCLTLCYPVDCNPQALLCKGFSRQEYWSGWAFPSPGYLPDPEIQPISVSCIGKWVLYHWCHLGSPIWIWGLCLFYKGLGFHSIRVSCGWSLPSWSPQDAALAESSTASLGITMLLGQCPPLPLPSGLQFQLAPKHLCSAGHWAGTRYEK